MPLVRSLEVFDDTTGEATPAPILSTRLVSPVPVVGPIREPNETLAACLPRHGHVRVADLANIMGTEEDSIGTMIAGYAYLDPANDARLIPAWQYLAGGIDTASLGTVPDSGSDSPILPGIDLTPYPARQGDRPEQHQD